MNDPNELFAQELRAAQPVAPAPAMKSAIARALAEESARAAGARGPRLSLWLSWTVAGIAACAAVAFAMRPPAQPERRGAPPAQFSSPVREAPTTAGSNRFRAVSSADYLCGARDEGIVVLDDGVAARKLRLRYVDTVRLRATGGPEAVDVSYPREEIRFVPITAY